MGERTVMDTADVSALTQRIQELERENARLKAILDKNGIEYGSFESNNTSVKIYRTKKLNNGSRVTGSAI